MSIFYASIRLFPFSAPDSGNRLHRIVHFLPFILILSICTAIHAVELPEANSNNDPPSGISKAMQDLFDTTVDQGIETIKKYREGLSFDRKLTPPVFTASLSAVARKRPDVMNARYVANDDEVYDRVTKLTWKRCSVGQRWEASVGCVALILTISFDQAENRVNERWRLPTIDELQSLQSHRAANSTAPDFPVDESAFPNMNPDYLCYWSNQAEDNSFARVFLYIEGGITGIIYRSTECAVRLVRNGPD